MHAPPLTPRSVQAYTNHKCDFLLGVLQTYDLSWLSYKKRSICLLNGYLLLTQSSFVSVHLTSYLKNVSLFSLELIFFKKDICCLRIFFVLIHFDFLFEKRSS